MKYLATVLSLFFSSFAFAHGEDQPGPHGGMIRMPATFHTEVVAISDQSFRVYLLSMQFDQATTQQSAVRAWVVQKKKKSELQCMAEAESFVCKGKSTFRSGVLHVKATRAGVEALQEARYTLTFK